MMRTSNATTSVSQVIVKQGDPSSLTTNAAVAQTSWGIETLKSGTAGSNTGTQERTLIEFDCYADDTHYVDIGPLWFSQA